jgi:3-dehydroquinate synthase
MALVALMGQDKKVIAGQLNFIMARDIGQAFVTTDVSQAVVLSVLEESMAARAV